MKKHKIEPRDYSQNGVERMVQVVKSRASCFLEFFNTPKKCWSCAVKLEVLCMNRLGVASLDWKSPCEVEFGEKSDTLCLKHKICQPVRVYDQFTTFPYHRWKNGRCLGVAQCSGDELNFIVEIDYEGRKQRLVRSVIQEKFPGEVTLQE